MRDTLQFVLQHGAQGHHHLFRPELIRAAFEGGTCLEGGVEPRVAEETDALLDRLQSAVDLHDQRSCIEHARIEVQHVMVHLYFHYLESFMVSRGAQLH